MLNKIRVLIGDDTVEYGIAFASTLRSLGWYVVTRPKDGNKILESIKNDSPDIVIIDAVMPGMDAIGMMTIGLTWLYSISSIGKPQHSQS